MRTLFAFVDPKDPFAAGEIAEDEQPGPILSVMGARAFDALTLFYTATMAENAAATRSAVSQRYPGCRVTLHELLLSDPKDYSAVMGRLARRLRELDTRGENYVCVSSGTAEMRAAWFLLVASGVLRATLLQVGSPAEPLFGARHVKEVRLDSDDWSSLRDLVMPQEYFAAEDACAAPAALAPSATRLSRIRRMVRAAEPAPPPEPYPGLEEALQELQVFVGSAVLREAAERAAVAARSDYPILLLGETGTGKEVFARLVHRLSNRREGSFVPINCAAIPDELVESHLFGHRKGAFTGASADQQGKFEEADGGTLFLDEIGELPAGAQAKLLRVLQDGVVEPIGAKPRAVEVRIVAATNRKLHEEIAARRFREDLYFRLEVVQIHLPPLRERPGDIAPLAAALLKQINRRRSVPRRLSTEALLRLERHSWPGNVRELRNVLQRSVLFAHEEVLEPGDLMITAQPSGPDPLTALPDPAPGFSLEDFLAQARRQLILRALDKCRGNQSAAAGLLGISKQAVSKFLRDSA
jgi:DNA-binding NtrC family response regulator